MLEGGIPRDRAVLLAGGPGSGKTTLAMEFVQAGLDAGEDCLFVSTEQSFAELADSLGRFDYDLDHERLSFATIHAKRGRTLEGDQDLVLEHLGGEDLSEGGRQLGDAFNVPFTARRIEEYLGQYAPCDRVVLDSASGLWSMTDDRSEFRRAVLDLIRFLSDEVGATSVLTAEAGDGTHGDDVTTPLRYNTHGVIELRREQVNGDPHRLLEVSKMRGTDIDRRTVELLIDEAGARLAPARRSQPPALKTHEHTPIGLPGLDALCGGGLATGAGVLFEHDGRATLAALYGAMFDAAFEQGFAVVLVPTIRLRPQGAATILEGRGYDLDTLLAEDRLFVLDMIGAWDEARRNVFGTRETAAGVQAELDAIADRVGDRRLFSLINADAMYDALGSADARRVRYFQEASLLGPDDMLVHVHNPKVTDEATSSFYANTAEQVIQTHVADDGLQYVSLRKSPCGFVGTTSLVQYTEEPPYLQVQRPPQERENPYAREPNSE
jgi:KaiC/GvpD/RAD55 family RecA-like ATPase